MPAVIGAFAVEEGAALISIEDNKDLVRRFFEEAWNKGNPEAVCGMIDALRPLNPLAKRDGLKALLLLVGG